MGALASVAAAVALSACGLDADEETSTATTPPTITGAATGPSGPSGPTGATGAEGSEEEEGTEAEPEEEGTLDGAGLGGAEPEPAT